ncbi:ABC transporter ATP-binding protein [Cellulomonas fengjieae]|uniref:ABC transporter ATP-binding protein n=1 Tax=Cellulomonas fengjieae TaxID=2819978 RepID=UPI001AAE603C|nr:ATP-binding cassette domain-containing protein [Cellulomonas fengjieae]MBO3102051.1 ATP-binding cassette domain-containing protein [Cellulomonas fengjieae]
MSALTLDSLNKSYGDLRALRDLSMEVPAGEIVGFVGSNGAGKSTAMRIVLGVLEADSGQVRWGGAPVDLAVRRRIGYMPEERGLYPRMKVSDQLVYLARLHGLDTASARAAMEQWTEVLGIADRRGDEILKLSLGNQQRVQLAAALVHSPEILVLDEPFSGLDPVAVDVMSGVLRAQADAGVPVLFSSHQLELVESLCDRVGIIKSGAMVKFGRIEELRRTDDRRWVVDGPPPQSWVSAVPSAHVVSTDGRRSVVEVRGASADTVDQDLLRSAMAAGPVHEFSLLRPSLTELYRHVVTTDSVATARETVSA